MVQTTFFNKGHHTTDMFVPSHQFSRSGFELDFSTVAGKSIVLEERTIVEAWVYEDVIKAMQDSVIDGLMSPKKFDDVKNLDDYAALFIPGGYDPVIDLNPYPSMGRTLRLAHLRDVNHDFSVPRAQRPEAGSSRERFPAQWSQHSRVPGQR